MNKTGIDSKDNTLDTCFSQSEQQVKNQKGTTGETAIINRRQNQIEILKQQTKQALGPQVYEQVTQFKYMRTNKNRHTNS